MPEATRDRVGAVKAVRPPRPLALELALALLIVGSLTDAIISLEGVATAATPEARALSAASVAIALLLALLGALLRTGRAWLVGLNVVAIAAFLEFRSVTIGGLLSSILDLAVVAVLLLYRPWFQWTPPDAPVADG